MSSAPVAAIVVLLTLSAVLLISGLAKVRDQRATRDAFDALRVPACVPADAAARILPWAEIALAVLLLVTPAGLLVPVTIALVVLMLTYAALVARALGFDEPVSCSCFGSLGRHDIDRTTLARNLLLLLLAVVAALFAIDGGSVPAASGELDAGGWWALVAAAAAATVASLVVGGGSNSPATRSTDAEQIDYDRQVIPYGVVALVDGTTSTLAELAVSHARLLVLLNRHCGPCTRTAAKLDDWAARLGPAVGVLAVYPDEIGSDGLGHARELGVVEPERNVRRVLGVGAPAALLLGADGLLAGGPVSGEDAVAEFVEDIAAELAVSRSQ